MQHEKYLNRFVTLFKSSDTNKDGIINEEQFKYLIREMKIIPQQVSEDEEKLEEEIEKLLVLIDPHKTQQITFSELVTFLTLTEFNQGKCYYSFLLAQAHVFLCLVISNNHNNLDIENANINSDIKCEETSENMSLTLLDKINEGMV